LKGEVDKLWPIGHAHVGWSWKITQRVLQSIDYIDCLASSVHAARQCKGAIFIENVEKLELSSGSWSRQTEVDCSGVVWVLGL
jgi:hypothetical protein